MTYTIHPKDRVESGSVFLLYIVEFLYTVHLGDNGCPLTRHWVSTVPKEVSTVGYNY